jgi:hypothetical protein
MKDPEHSPQAQAACTQLWRIARHCVPITLAMVPAALAQYSYDPTAADETGPGIKYFGSAKDDKGALMQGVTVFIEGDSADYVFVTDDQGRFRGKLPPGTLPEKVMAKCFKFGFQTIAVNKRPGPQGPKPTVQVDCVLRPEAAK